MDLRRDPFGALDVHWYLLHECCWPGADRALWRRARPLDESADGILVPAPADQLLHACIHGLHWSLVHGGYWVADAVQIIRRAGAALDWTALVEDAAARQLGYQMHEALRAVAARGHVSIPDTVLRALAAQPTTWSDCQECRLKGRPVVSAGGLFVIHAGWRRARRVMRAEGLRPLPRWWRYFAAALGVQSMPALGARLAGHAGRRLAALVGRGPRRGATSRERLTTDPGPS
jgi:hypothetical protein